MSRKIVSTNLRFNMAEPDEKRAWEYLQRLDRLQYKSYTKAVVAAVNECFDRRKRLEADPYLETRQKEDEFLQRVVDAVKEGAREVMPTVSAGALVQLLQAGSIQSAALLHQDQGAIRYSSGIAANGNMTIREDADAALDFADGF